LATLGGGRADFLSVGFRQDVFSPAITFLSATCLSVFSLAYGNGQATRTEATSPSDDFGRRTAGQSLDGQRRSPTGLAAGGGKCAGDWEILGSVD
jgi:hypothetical protein